MNILLFNEVCLYDTNKTIIYGQYDVRFTSLSLNPNINHKCVFCENRNDFYIEIYEKILYINNITFVNSDNKIIKTDIFLSFPFEKCDLKLNDNSAIITTMCKDYSSRLEEWIKYNLNLGFTGIIIFDNDYNNTINESLNYTKNNGNTKDICNKYKGKVWCVKFNYKPIKDEHWNTIQRIALHIGVNAFRSKCEKIALIDADEFIYIPNKSNIIDFFKNYKGQTLTIQSNILTNKSNNDIIDNNILDLCLYIGEDKYTKTILDTSKIETLEFVVSPHDHRSQLLLNKETIIHYHCWVNERYIYNENMIKIEYLK
jgi:hypothetical protein